jgi:hypothetical protein
MSGSTHRRAVSAAIAVATIAFGLVWRLAPLGLPRAAHKYGGSALWAVMVYWLCALALPRVRPLRLGLIAAGVAAMVERVKLLHTPGLDAFRLTLAGRLLLGRFFSLRDIAVYWMAIAVVALLDEASLRYRRS